MKLEIKVEFTDKNTGEKYRVGDVKDFSESRAKELLADKRNLVIKCAETKQSAPEKEKPKATRIKK